MTPTRRRTVPLLAFIVLALLAAADGVYLTLVHLDYETGRVSVSTVCHKLAEHGCAVTAGRFGSIAQIPVALFGFAAAATMVLLGTLAFRRRYLTDDPLRSILVLMAATSVLASVAMAVASVLERSFCPFCLAWYGLNLGLFVCAWLVRDRGPRLIDALDDALSGAGFVAALSFTVLLVTGAWLHHRERARILKAQETELAEQAPSIARELAAELRKQTPKTFESEALPRKGPDDAPLVIVEFSDFGCPFCRNLWLLLETYEAEHRGQVQVRFANFPLDGSCNPLTDTLHPHACDAAAAALCAERQDKFWDYGSLLFEHQRALERADLRGYAEQLGLDVAAFEACLDDPVIAQRVRDDIALGGRLEIGVTPTYYVNGRELEGSLPPPIFSALMDELTREPRP